MRRENTSLDEQILGLAPAHNWGFTYRRELYGAFEVTERGLVALESHLRDIIASVSPNMTAFEIVKVVSLGGLSEVYSSLQEVVALRNPRTERITGINIRMINSEALVSIWLDDIGLYSCHAIVLLFAADSDTNFAKYEASLEKELKNLECWYSYGRKSLDRVHAVAEKVPPLVFMVLLFVGLASTVFSFFSETAKHARWRTAAEEILREYDSLSSSKPSLDPNIVARANEIRSALQKYQSPGSSQVVVEIIQWIAYVFVAFVCLRFIGYLFPRVVFEIGEGKRRHDQCLWLRRFVIGSVVVCGVILPLVRKVFHWP